MSQARWTLGTKSPDKSWELPAKPKIGMYSGLFSGLEVLVDVECLQERDKRCGLGVAARLRRAHALVNCGVTASLRVLAGLVEDRRLHPRLLNDSTGCT